MKTRISILLLAGILVLGCEKKQEQANDKGLYEETTGGTEKSEESKKPVATTTMEFEETEFNFGTINEGQMVTHSFKLKNTGEHPLVISDDRADCGCTVPNPPKEPIMPGKESQIKVKFNSSGKGGQTVTKTVTVLANTEPSDSKLMMKGTVRGKDEGTPLR